MVKYICERCMKEAPKSHVVRVSIKSLQKNKTIDFCKSCYKILFEFDKDSEMYQILNDTFMQRSTEELSPFEEKKRDGNKRKYDHLKIIDMYQDKVSVSDIAERIGCTKGTVYAILEQHGLGPKQKEKADVITVLAMIQRGIDEAEIREQCNITKMEYNSINKLLKTPLTYCESSNKVTPEVSVHTINCNTESTIRFRETSAIFTHINQPKLSAKVIANTYCIRKSLLANIDDDHFADCKVMNNDIIGMYMQGKSVVELSKVYQVSCDAVSTFLKTHCDPDYMRVDVNTDSPIYLDDKLSKSNILRSLSSGMTIDQAAELNNCSVLDVVSVMNYKLVVDTLEKIDWHL